MTKRVKPVLNIPVVNTVEDADSILAEIAARKRQISLHEIALKEDVDKLKTECAARCEPLKKTSKPASRRLCSSHWPGGKSCSRAASPAS